jgi:hypothetical protein
MLTVLLYAVTVAVPEMSLMTGTPALELPIEGHNWDFIAAFRLTDVKGRKVTIRLYAYDSDSVADKLSAKGQSALVLYPNMFSLHAMYWVGKGEWQHKEVLSAARVRFVQVKERGADSAVLELRPNFWHTLGDLKQAKKEGREINKPFTRKLSLSDGVPVVK